MADGRRLRCIHGSGETEILTSMKKSILISLLALLMMGCQVSGGSSLKVEETTVEMRKNPEGVAVSAPRFSWQLVTDKQDVMQTAYQIEVADSDKGLQAGSGLVWNSGRVESGQSVLVKYAGAPLESGQKYWWRVTVWTNTGDKAQSSIQYCQWLCWTVRTGKPAGLD